MTILKSLGIAALLVFGLSSAYSQAAAPLVTRVTNDEGETLVADSISRTLYVFDMDKTSTSSACNGTCAEIWPPYLLTDAEAAALQAPLGSIQRANKKLQLTYKSRPVYTYAFDRQAGDDHGDGIGGVWHYIEE